MPSVFDFDPTQDPGQQALIPGGLLGAPPQIGPDPFGDAAATTYQQVMDEMERQRRQNATQPGLLDQPPIDLKTGNVTPQGMQLAGLMSGFAGGIKEVAPAPGLLGVTAYHGSPHSFDAFSNDAIGTGEGAQAYGHGLYFAENEGVARGYRDSNATRK